MATMTVCDFLTMNFVFLSQIIDSHHKNRFVVDEDEADDIRNNVQ